MTRQASLIDRQGRRNKMAPRSSQVCLALLSLFPCVFGGYIKEYVLDEYCGKTITMGLSEPAIKLKHRERSHVYEPVHCRVHIEADFMFTLSKRLTAQFLDINIDCSNHVKLSSFTFGQGGRYCGASKPLPYISFGSDLYVEFISDAIMQDNGFTLLINSFHTGICRSYEFECDNGRCIGNDLRNEGYDNCGDNSDEVVKGPRYTYNTFRAWWILIIVGIVVIIICVVITVICCCIFKRRRPGHIIRTDTQTVVSYQSGTQGLQVNPWHGSPIQPTASQSAGVHGLYQPGSQPPAYTNASGSTVYPSAQSSAPEWEAHSTAPPPYSEKM